MFGKFFSLFYIISTQTSHIYKKLDTNSWFAKLRAISNLFGFFLYTLYIYALVLWRACKDPYDIYVHASNIWTQSSDWLITDSNEVIDKLPYTTLPVCKSNAKQRKAKLRNCGNLEIKVSCILYPC